MEEQHLQRFLIGSVCAARIRVYAYIDHVSNHTEKAQPISGCAFYDSKGLYFDNDGQNHRPLFVSLYMNFPT